MKDDTKKFVNDTVKVITDTRKESVFTYWTVLIVISALLTLGMGLLIRTTGIVFIVIGILAYFLNHLVNELSLKDKEEEESKTIVVKKKP